MPTWVVGCRRLHAALDGRTQGSSGSQATFQRLQNETSLSVQKLQQDVRAKKQQVRRGAGRAADARLHRGGASPGGRPGTTLASCVGAGWAVAQGGQGAQVVWVLQRLQHWSGQSTRTRVHV